MNSTNSSAPDDIPPEPSGAALKSKGPLWKRAGKFVVFRVLFWYAVICLLAMIFQRKLMYHPEATEKLALSEAMLPQGAVKEFQVQTADDLTLAGWRLLPSVSKENTKPNSAGNFAVLFFNGNAGDRRVRVADSQVFTRTGTEVFLIDYRGYAENPGSPSETGLNEDARGLWKFVTQTSKIPPERIVIFGESLGGGVAVQLAAELCQAGTPPAGLIVRSTFSSMADAASRHYPWLPVRILLWDRYPSADSIRDVTCPILVIHGTADRIVPWKLGKKLFDAAPPRSLSQVRKAFVSLDGANHNDLMYSHGQEFSEAISDFLANLANSQR